MEFLFFVLTALFLILLVADRILLYWLYKHFKEQLPKRKSKKANLAIANQDNAVRLSDEKRGLIRQHPERIIGVIKPIGFWTDLAIKERREELEAMLEVDQNPKYKNMGFWQKWSVAGKLVAGRRINTRGGRH